MKKKTHEEFILEMKSINPNILTLGRYDGNKTKIDVECKICGHKWCSKPNNLLSGYGCPKCSHRYKRTNEEFIKEIQEINPNIKILSKFENVSTKVKCSCKVCNHIWEITPNHLLQGIGCPQCKTIKISNYLRGDPEEFIDKLRIVNPNIEPLSKYEYALKKIKCKCKICGHKWQMTPANLLNNHGCPRCNKSKGEEAISTYLSNNNIPFDTQKKFYGLYGVRNGLLSYDFYLPEQNVLIEFQGKQHKYPVKFDGKGDIEAEHRFEIQKEHDKRKREYAKLHNINLIEIWYYDFKNINSVLDRELKSII